MFAAVGFAEADDVEPVAAPAFAVVGGVEVLLGSLVVRKFIVIGGGGQAGEIEAEAANEDARVGAGGEFEILGAELLVEEGIDGVGFAGRGRHFDGRLEGPELPLWFYIPDGALGDPGFDGCEFGLGKAGPAEGHFAFGDHR